MRSKISNIIRIFLSVILIIASLLKLIGFDNFVSTVNMFVDSYLIGIPFSIVYSLSIIIIVSEFIIGFIGLFNKLRVISLPLIMSIYFAFTIITFLNYFFPTSLGSIHNCRCFGDLLYLSPLASFFKSTILFVMSLFSEFLVWERKLANTRRCVLRILSFLLVFPVSETASAQGGKSASEVRLGVGVEDSFTKVGLPAHVTLMNSDSLVIDTATCKVYEGYSSHTFYIPGISGDYILRAEYPGYRTAEKRQHFDFSQKKYGWGFETVQLKRLPTAEDSLRSVNLDEVVVTGTRLQVAYRGDTIVYDASAFNIPEGAMLDALVRQLPGAELKTNGDVYINGKRLDYITLNGNDFFKGRNKVILENLPYFTVKELKVYYKDPPFALIKPTTDEEKDYVLDVVMKREYSIGSIVNTELGLGTDNRWKSKAFGLRYSDHVRLSVFGNLNNTNENRTPGADGDWSPRKQQRGLLTTKQAGLNLNMNNSKKTLSVDQDLLFEWSDENTSMRQARERFVSGSSSIFGGTVSADRTKDFSLTNRTRINMKVGRSGVGFSNYLFFTDRDAANTAVDSTYSTSLTNTDRKNSLTDRRNINGNGALFWNTVLFGSNTTSVYLNYSFSKQFHDRYSLLRNILYSNTGETDNRHDYRDNSSRSYSYSLSLSQDFVISPKFSLNYGAAYRQWGNGNDNCFYNLADYGGKYADSFVLPSTADSLAYALNAGNSYRYFTWGRGISQNLHISYSWKNFSAFLSLRYTYTHERIHYNREAVDTVARRSYGTWNPNFQLQYDWGKNSFKVNYYSTDTRPAFNQLMPLTDNSNTLSVKINNPQLKSQIRHNVKISLDMRPGGMKPAWWVSYELVKVDRAWGNRVRYDAGTGIYTFVADNVNGNWNTSLTYGMNGYLVKNKRWRYEISAKMKYNHSVDFNTAYTEDESELSRVNTIIPETSWKLNYRKGDFSAGAIAKFSGNYSHEEHYGKRDMKVYSWQLGTNSQYTIPVLKLTVATDLNLYMQRGYEQSYMNTNDWIWNASLSRPLLKGNLVAKVELYDILHELSARSYRVDAQSHIETFYNSIPHYIMFSLSYKFAKKPKK